MRIVISEFISLDGVVQAPAARRRTPTAASPTAAGRTLLRPGGDGRHLRGHDLQGRGPAVRASHVAEHGGAWPERAGDPLADRLNALPKYVVSETLGDAELTWENTTRIPGAEAIAGIRKLHEADGGDLLVMGSPTLVRTLLHEGLVDELRLMIMPVIVGGGKTIFPGDGALRPLELVSTVTSGTGVHVCTYRPVAEG
ncbi:dihydrofolate reductase family protein [Streptomyces sp. M10(2022)]